MRHSFRAILLLVFGVVWVQAACAEPVVYEVDGQPYEGYWASAGDTAPLVLLIHDWDGLTDYEIKRAQMLVENGFSVFAADLFGQGVRPTEIAARRKCTGELSADRPKMRALMQGALDAAGKQGGDVNNAVTMGYCFGGTAVLEFARSGADLKGFATFHGGLALPEGQDYTQTKGKVLILHGTADTGIPMSQFAQLADDLEKAKIDHEMITYGGAPHAWTVFGSGRYREQADKDSWVRFLGFLSEILK